MYEAIAWTGAFFFSICGMPQAWEAYKNGYQIGLSHMMIWFWFLGECCMLIYSFHLRDAPLFTNYALNFLCLLVIIKYMYFPRKS